MTANERAAQLVTRLCKFNCDAESDCTCPAHELYRLALLEGEGAPPCVKCGTHVSVDGDWYRLCGKCRWEGEGAPHQKDSWQPIASAPKDGTHFLAASKFMGQPTVELIWWDLGYGSWQGAQSEQRFDAWMPLPLGPAGTPPQSGKEPDERKYPCDRCDTLRTKAEGGAVFTVCEACWDVLQPAQTPVRA